MPEFNPEKHITELQGKAYLEVKWRLVWFRQECPNGTIDTEEIQVDIDREVEAEVPTGKWIPNPNRPDKKMPEKMVKRDKGYARFKATVTDGKGGRATATKCENAAAFPDYIEKAETGAVGRALAMLGFGTQFTADELSEEHRLVDAPVDRRASTPAPAAPTSQRPAPAQQPTNNTVTQPATNGATKTVTPNETVAVQENKKASVALENMPTVNQLSAEIKTLNIVSSTGVVWNITDVIRYVFKARGEKAILEMIAKVNETGPEDCMKIVGFLAEYKQKKARSTTGK